MTTIFFNNDEKVVAYVTITKMPSNFISIKTSTFITQIFNSNNF
jgi:hypothetical protein